MLLDTIPYIVLAGIFTTFMLYLVYKLYRYSLKLRDIKNELRITEALRRQDRNVDYGREQQNNEPFDSKRHKTHYRCR